MAADTDCRNCRFLDAFGWCSAKDAQVKDPTAGDCRSYEGPDDPDADDDGSSPRLASDPR